MVSANYPDHLDLLQLWENIDARNRRLGWARYDYADLRIHPWLLSIRPPRLRYLAERILRSLDIIAPLYFHNLIKQCKTVVPTAFYHVGIAYLLREQFAEKGKEWPRELSESICREAAMIRLPAEHFCWTHPYALIPKQWIVHPADLVPPSCAHHTARLGALLLETGSRHQNPELIAQGISAATAMITYHNWNEYPDGACTVSYYPATGDETINIGADTAVLLASIPDTMRSPLCQKRFDGLLRMILNEQQKDGSWFYCTERHYNQFNAAKIIDNHHSAQVIQALAKILCKTKLPDSLGKEVRSALTRGLAYYIHNFYQADGKGAYFPDSVKSCPVTGYSEGLSAIYWADQCGILNQDTFKSLKTDFVPRMLTHCLSFIDLKTWDVACTKFFGGNYHIQSLRWGSGPMLEAIMVALLLNPVTQLEG